MLLSVFPCYYYIILRLTIRQSPDSPTHVHGPVIAPHTFQPPRSAKDYYIIWDLILPLNHWWRLKRLEQRNVRCNRAAVCGGHGGLRKPIWVLQSAS
eukprot:7299236-Prymnesium_polylepis.1